MKYWVSRIRIATETYEEAYHVLDRMVRSLDDPNNPSQRSGFGYEIQWDHPHLLTEFDSGED